MQLNWIIYGCLSLVVLLYWRDRSAVAKRWLVIGFAAIGAMFFAGYCSMIAFCSPFATGGQPEWVLFAGLGFLLGGAVLMHFDDQSHSGYGVVNLWHFEKGENASEPSHYRKPLTGGRYNFVSTTLTRESVQVAVTLGLMAMIVTRYREWTAFKGLFSDPHLLLRHLVVGALGLSVVTTLASILCYDYAIRFNWVEAVVSMFIHKAHRLGRIGFYSLMMSLAGMAGLVSWQVGILAIGLIYFVMWYYYFFSKSGLDRKVPRPEASHPANVTGSAVQSQGTVALETAVTTSESAGPGLSSHSPSG